MRSQRKWRAFLGLPVLLIWSCDSSMVGPGSAEDTVGSVAASELHAPPPPPPALGNVALNATVTLQGGSFFTGGWGGGWVVSPQTVVDGVFVPRGTQWDRGPVWWDGRDGVARYIVMDLGSTCLIDQLIVQADDNDAYILWFWDEGAGDWTVAWPVPNYNPYGWGMQTRPNPADDTQRYQLSAPLVTTALRIAGNPASSDGFYAVSEIQAFGYCWIPVDIDIKPGSDPNSINADSKGVVPVALFGRDDFDVRDVDFTSLTLLGGAPATPAHRKGHYEDVNGDGYGDLISHYRTQNLRLSPSDTEACLSGSLNTGEAFSGCDAIRVLGEGPGPPVDDVAPVISNLEPDASVTVLNPDANGNGVADLPGDYALTFDAVDPPLSDGSPGSGVDETGCLAGGPCAHIAATVLTGPAGAPATFAVDNLNTLVSVDPDFLVRLHSGGTPLAPDGDYQIELSVPDNLGNLGTAMYGFNLDATPPVHGALNPAPVGSSGTDASAIVMTIGGSIDDANVIDRARLTVYRSTDPDCNTFGDNAKLVVGTGADEISQNDVDLTDGTNAISFNESFTIQQPSTAAVTGNYCFIVTAEDEAVLADGTDQGNFVSLTVFVVVVWNAG